MIEDYKDFAEYISKDYRKAKKIVEVGIGRESGVFEELKKSIKGEVIAVDISPERGVIRDDILQPREEIYKGADLVYAVRPPPDLLPYLEAIAKRVGADLIIRPLSTDLVGRKITNYKKTFFYKITF